MSAPACPGRAGLPAETAAALLAVAKLGAAFTPIFSGYAAPAIAARLNDAGCKLLITADGFYRRGHAVGMKAVADEAVAAAPEVEHVVVVRRPGTVQTPWTPGRDVWYHDLTARRRGKLATVAASSAAC